MGLPPGSQRRHPGRAGPLEWAGRTPPRRPLRGHRLRPCRDTTPDATEIFRDLRNPKAARDLDQALDCGHRALDILARVTSARAENYLRAITTALTPWAADARVRDFTEHLDQRLTH